MEAGNRAKENTRPRSPPATEKHLREGGWVLRLGRAPSRPKPTTAEIPTPAHPPAGPDLRRTRAKPIRADGRNAGPSRRGTVPPKSWRALAGAWSPARSAVPIRPRRSSDPRATDPKATEHRGRSRPQPERSLALSFKESQPDQRARPWKQDKDSKQRSQSTRGVIGLEISVLLCPC